MKYSYILFLSLILFKLPSCQRHDMYQPGYNFELFANTPAYYPAKAVEKQDT